MTVYYLTFNVERDSPGTTRGRVHLEVCSWMAQSAWPVPGGTVENAAHLSVTRLDGHAQL